MKRWLKLLQQRFNPLQYSITIIFFVVAHITVASKITKQIQLSWSTILLYISTFLFFLLLRLFDELKDYDIDKKIHKDRPLVTGLVSIKETKQVVKGVIIIILFLTFFSSLQGGIAFTFTTMYSLLMYKEFFVRSFLRRHLLLYAVSHTLVSTLLSIAIFSTLTSLNFWELPRSTYIFALSSWCIFNIFEFGRKTYAKSEEAADKDSYSKTYSKLGATSLVVVMLSCIQIVISALGFEFVAKINFLIIAVCICVAMLYVLKDSKRMAQVYRGFCSIYLIIIYMLVSLHMGK